MVEWQEGSQQEDRRPEIRRSKGGKGRQWIERVTDIFRKPRVIDPDLILQEITSTKEMKYYLNARSFWTSNERKQMIKGNYIEGPSLARVNRMLPFAQEVYKLRNILPTARNPLITEILYATHLKRGLAEALYEKAIIPTKSVNQPSFAEWYSRYLPNEDRSIYEGAHFDGKPKSWDKFLEVDLSLTLAFMEFTRDHPDSLNKA